MSDQEKTIEVTAVSGADAKRFAIEWRLAKEAGRG